ncbi:gamma-glutamyl-gamma-aminobutyrate hydrolase family protein [Paeniglutamicibacter sp. R2-26]|uniref:gamma-glutamyl-gamma-aminobutyrate hydrolase family protein n=1 Tax=Paeniglutamicibacter sp. R2-26 TaxID=3144417 RepID=UPI003EE54184
MPIPAIAIAGRLSEGADTDPRVVGANRIFHDVVALVAASGLSPVVVTDPGVDLAEFAGLVLPGGGDLDPALYGGESSPAVYDINPVQDELDLGLAKLALDLGIPVLGICRGAQVLNVACGGTLVADLEPSCVEHYHQPGPGEDLEFLWHPVRLAEGSAIRAEFGAAEMNVASGHHQGIDRLGEGLRAVAVAADGLVEAFEDESGRFLGVQWHPEAVDTPSAVQNVPFKIFARHVSGSVVRA